MLLSQDPPPFPHAKSLGAIPHKQTLGVQFRGAAHPVHMALNREEVQRQQNTLKNKKKPP